MVFGSLLARRLAVAGRLDDVAAHDIRVPPGRGVSTAATVPPRPAVRFVLGGALRALLFVDQRLPIGDWNLVIIGMDFAERQEAVAIAAVIDERGLQRRLDARHLRQIDVAS